MAHSSWLACRTLGIHGRGLSVVSAALTLLILAPGSGVCQTPKNTSAAGTAAFRYEEIEIMRRLLRRELQGYQQAVCATCHVPARALAVWADGNNLALQANKGMSSYGSLLPTTLFLDVDGTYLDGYGVLYHVAMPPMPHGKTESAKPATKSVSDWERTRQEVRGEKIDKAPEPRSVNVPDLTDLLLKVIADNGHHFATLGAKENLAIIVSFRPANDPHRQVSPGTIFMRTPTAGGTTGLPGAAPSLVPPPMASPPNAAADSDRLQHYLEGHSGIGDFELLADLQLKQGRAQEAIASYQRAVAAQPESKRLASLYQKLAQATLKQDAPAGRAEDIEKAIGFLKMAQTTRAAPGAQPNASSEMFLSKLIVSAPKTLLDAAGKGMSAGEFRAGARVEQVISPDRHADHKLAPSVVKPANR